MRRLKQIFWTALALAVLFLGIYLGFTVSHWLQTGSGLRFEKTATVV